MRSRLAAVVPGASGNGRIRVRSTPTSLLSVPPARAGLSLGSSKSVLRIEANDLPSHVCAQEMVPAFESFSLSPSKCFQLSKLSGMADESPPVALTDQYDENRS